MHCFKHAPINWNTVCPEISLSADCLTKLDKNAIKMPLEDRTGGFLSFFKMRDVLLYFPWSIKENKKRYGCNAYHLLICRMMPAN